MTKRIFIYCVVFCLFCSCLTKPAEIVNEYQSQLSSSYTLVEVGGKAFPLDEHTTPKPVYLQFEEISSDVQVLSLLNKNNKSIYIYDFHNEELAEMISLTADTLQRYGHILAFYVKSRDSIYLFDESRYRILRVGNKYQINDSISLIGDFELRKFEWTYRYPQYFANTSSPLFECSGRVLFAGLYPWAIPDSIIPNFGIIGVLGTDLEAIDHIGHYPESIYGSPFDWDDPIFTTPYYDWNPANETVVLSFPVSHELFICNPFNGQMTPIYGGSNFASNISSIGKHHSDDKKYEARLIRHIRNTDLYGAIKYDAYRNVYYRFVRMAVPEDDNTHDFRNKPLGVIVMDEHFNYLGETTIGKVKDWNWENSFVSNEGLVIEYIDNETYDESYLRFKIFAPQKL